jgi:hypothetical protein
MSWQRLGPASRRYASEWGSADKGSALRSPDLEGVAQMEPEIYAEQASRHDRFVQDQTQTTRAIPVVAQALRRERPFRLPTALEAGF